MNDYNLIFFFLENLPFPGAYHRILTDGTGKPVDYEYIKVNQEYENLIGHSGITGKKFSELSDDADLSPFDRIDLFGTAAINQTSDQFEHYIASKDGWFTVKVFSPEKMYFIVMLVGSSGQDTEKIMKEKTRFFATMTHEIRSPMNAIIGMINLAMMSDDHMEQIDYLIDARASADYMLNIVNEILDFSKVDAGAITLEQIDFSPAFIVESSVSMFKQIAKEKKIYLKINVSSDSPQYHTIGDPYRLKQILVNIINNAVKFTENGGVEVFFQFSKPLNNEVTLELKVTDTGIGIDPSHLKKIFNSFTQADPAISRKFGGTGLGLSISREIVKLMNGDISVKSEPGSGSTFTVKIPFKLSAGQIPMVIGSYILDNSYLLKGLDILIADDNPVNTRIMAIVLIKAGHNVTIAYSGNEVINQLQTKKIDCVLLDIEMPDMTGLKVSSIVREGGAGETAKNIPIIAMTGHDSDEMKQKCRIAGMDGFITKPIRIEDINILITKTLKNKIN